MKRLIVLGFMLVFLSACAGLRVSSYTIEGDDIKSHYADGNATVEVQVITAWAFWRTMPEMPSNVILVFKNKEDKDGG